MGFCVRDSISALRDLHYRLVDYLYKRKRTRCFQGMELFVPRAFKFLPNRQTKTLYRIRNLLKFCLWNPGYSSKNPVPTIDWNPESKFHWQRLESSTWKPLSKAVLNSLTWGEQHPETDNCCLAMINNQHFINWNWVKIFKIRLHSEVGSEEVFHTLLKKEIKHLIYAKQKSRDRHLTVIISLFLDKYKRK